MRKIFLLIGVVAIVGLAIALFLTKSTPSPKEPPKMAPKKPVIKPDFHAGHDDEFFDAHGDKNLEDKHHYAESFYQNAYLDDDFNLESQRLYAELDSLDQFSDPWQHEQYQYLYDEFAQDELQREYEEEMMFEYDLWELERLNQIYSDPDVHSYREAEVFAKRGERKGHKWDDKEIDALPNDRKDLLNDLADFGALGMSKKSKNERSDALGRAHEATKGKSTDEVRNIRDKLSDKVAVKEKEKREKFIKERLEKAKGIATEIKNETTLFQASKGDVKFYLFGVQENLSLEESLPQALEKKILGSKLLITNNRDFEIKKLFDEEKKTVLVLEVQDVSPEHILDGIDPDANQKVLVAITNENLVSDKGLLQVLISQGYQIKRYNIEGKGVPYTPLKRP